MTNRPNPQNSGLSRRKLLFRAAIYLIGLFLVAMGVAFSIKSSLGISPASSLPYVFSLAASWPLRLTVTIVYAFLVLLQWLILGKRFHWRNVFQVLFAVIFGYFCDLSVLILGNLSCSSYFGRLALLSVSIVLISLGVTLYVGAKLLPLPVEGLALALSSVSKKVKFPVFKIIIDASLVLSAAALSLIAFGTVEGVREGTVLSALAVGFVVRLLQKPLTPLIDKICF